jgi:hypothetical protein
MGRAQPGRCEAPSRGFVAERAVRSPGNRAIALDGQSKVGNGCYYLRLAEGALFWQRSSSILLDAAHTLPVSTVKPANRAAIMLVGLVFEAHAAERERPGDGVEGGLADGDADHGRATRATGCCTRAIRRSSPFTQTITQRASPITIRQPITGKGGVEAQQLLDPPGVMQIPPSATQL